MVTMLHIIAISIYLHSFTCHWCYPCPWRDESVFFECACIPNIMLFNYFFVHFNLLTNQWGNNYKFDKRRVWSTIAIYSLVEHFCMRIEKGKTKVDDGFYKKSNVCDVSNGTHMRIRMDSKRGKIGFSYRNKNINGF